ncbi:ClpXP protease specificity-enhancing factor [Leminorella grimontii]|uniref:ClpXP protease specificity-enhancing factor n=1 Tax=Leminorella grimontii TaxID=82981 RepID=UPI0020833891|nr:ClpXP protease specificity-enhancing factor [Leminorella grimontii]GKX59957.1 stringent starvation protein B [Leminorella grimontii]
MTPRRPYLLRAVNDWLLDNGLTPHLIVDATVVGVVVPMEFVRDGQIVLNIAPRSVGNLELGNDEIRFNARFGGVPRRVEIPLAAVLAIYARENGAGMAFEPEEYPDAHGFEQEEIFSDEIQPESGIHLVLTQEESAEKSDADGDDDEPTPPPRGRPALRVVK